MSSPLISPRIVQRVSLIAVYAIGQEGVTRHTINDKRRVLTAMLIFFLAVGPALLLAGCLKGRYVPKRRVSQPCYHM
ncbi:MAG: hypothetical protein IVW55_14150 [Chloroflexi bacterium]|nr:hypothetical protein [Chloroflexota bacterium]